MSKRAHLVESDSSSEGSTSDEDDSSQSGSIPETDQDVNPSEDLFAEFEIYTGAESENEDMDGEF